MRVFTLFPALMAAVLLSGCTTGRSQAPPMAGAQERIWKLPSFGKVLKTEILLQPDNVKAAPQLDNLAQTRVLARAIDEQYHCRLHDWIVKTMGRTETKVWLFGTLDPPTVLEEGKQELRLEREGEPFHFRWDVSVMPPVGTRTVRCVDTGSLLPELKMVTLAYRLVCDPGTTAERKLCFHRRLRLQPRPAPARETVDKR
jgi:hypothetical protein